jgi:prevent-host-death family protein
MESIKIRTASIKPVLYYESMTVTIGIQDAKARLSELVEQARNGEEIVITKRGQPAATLVAPAQPTKRVFGFLGGGIQSDFTEPLSDDELKDWGIE